MFLFRCFFVFRCKRRIVKKTNRLGLGMDMSAAFGYQKLFRYVNEYAKDGQQTEPLVFGAEFSDKEKSLVKP